MIRKNQDGATVIEFALVAPLLFLLIFGIIEFGLLLFNKHVITTACREGARAGIVARENRFVLDDNAVPVISTVNDWIANNLVTFGGTDQPEIYVGETDFSGTFVGYYESTEAVTIMDDSVRNTGYRDPLTVRVSYEYHFLFLSSIGLGPIDLVSQAKMLME